MGPLSIQGSVLYTLAMAEDVGAARRAARDLAAIQGASEADVGRVELVVTELGTNTLHHAKPPGYLLLSPLAPSGQRGLEIVAVDNGPGITHLAEVLHGVASRFERATDNAGRGLGCGLGSVRRLANEFDAHSVLGQGTVVLARFRFAPADTHASDFRVGAVSVPLAGEVENGDAWAFLPQRDGCAVVVADGLGHGPHAARASAAAVAAFRAEPEVELERYMRDAHTALRGTRGAAVTICRIYPARNVLRFAGLGNVEGRVQLALTGESLTPRSGTLGMNLAPTAVRVRELPWQPGATLVLHSDGIRNLHDPAERSELDGKDPSLIAALRHRDYTRGRDDATVVVVQDARLRR